MTHDALPPLGELFVRRRFDQAGFPPMVADAYRSLLRDAHQALDDAEVPSDQRRVWIVPGRIEVLGKHVDYAGGRSLLAAGVVGVEGTFAVDDAVEIVDGAGRVVAKGLARAAADTVRANAGRRSDELADGEGEVVHRDDLVVLP